MRWLREVIEKLVKGVFEYESDKLIFDVPSIEKGLAKDETYSGSFRIGTESNQKVKGLVYSSNKRLICETKEFNGNDVTIRYTFDTNGLDAGDVIKGDIRIVSEAGEYYLPFSFSIVHKIMEESGENVRNIYHFAKQAQEDFRTATKLFYTPEFIRVFDGNDRVHLTKYRGFSNIEGSGQALEDFLISINKKNEIEYSTDKGIYEYIDVTRDLRCQLDIYKSTWGYVDINVYADEDFIELEKTKIRGFEFDGSIYRLFYNIRADRLHGGRNYGKIYIEDAHQRAEVTIIVSNNGRASSKRAASREMKALTFRLSKCYIQFRTKQITIGTWVRDSMKIVERMNLLDDKNPVSRLFQAQLLIVEERFNEAKWILDHVETQMDLMDASEEVQCYYLYLTTLYKRDNAYVDEVGEKLLKHFKRNQHSMPIFWMLLYIDEELSGSNSKKLTAIERMYRQGCVSPIIYVEAYNIFVSNHLAITKLSGFEINVISFGVKYGKISRDMIEQVAMLAYRTRDFSEKILKLLSDIYDLYNDADLVESACAMLIRSSVTDEKYHVWYERGVELGLKITRLYEYFMYSLPKKYDRLIPKAVIMYFGFQNQLSFEKKASLYANLIRFKKQGIELYNTYQENMLVFAIEQVMEDRINNDLAVIYEEVLTPDVIRPNMASHLSKIIFAKAVSCNDDDIESVVLIQEEFEGEFVYPVVDNMSYPYVYSNNVTIFYEYKDGHRSIVPLSAIKALVNESVYVPLIRRYVVGNLPFLLYLCEGKRGYISIDEGNADFCRDLVESEYITERLKADLRIGLMHYYYDADRNNTLDEFLLNTDIGSINCADRNKILEFLVKRGLYENAYDMIATYGDENTDADSVFKICSHIIGKADRHDDNILVKYTYNAFLNGKYDNTTLAYLVNNYEGLTKELRNIWKAAKAFSIDCYSLVEKILVQMLFSGTSIAERDEIFEEYRSRGGNKSVEMAYLTYLSYEYFVKERTVSEAIFEIIVSNYRAGERLNDACKLALLKFYAENPEAKTQRIRDMIYMFIQEYLHRNIYFKFFSVYVDEIPELSAFSDALFVEYRANPNSKVLLHYCLEDGSESSDAYRTEEMKNMFGGIFSKEFILFFGENLQYYVTESVGGKERLTISDTATITETSSDGSRSRYNQLNEMVVSKTLQDESTLMELMEEYVEEDNFAREVFGIL